MGGGVLLLALLLFATNDWLAARLLLGGPFLAC